MKQIYTHILTRTTLRLLLFLLVMVGGVSEMTGQEYNYTVREVYGNHIFDTKTGTATSEDFKVSCHRYNLLNGELYIKDGVNVNRTDNDYRVTVKSTNANIDVQYKSHNINNVVYLSEAEDINGLTLCLKDKSNMDSRSSNSAAAYAEDGNVEATTLKKGVYRLTAAIHDAAREPSSDWKFYAGDEEIASFHCNMGNYQEFTSGAFVIEKDDTPIYIGNGGGNSSGIDLIYIQRIGDAFDVLKWAKEDNTVVKSVTVDISDVDNNNQSDALPSKLLNAADKTITYASSNVDVASMEYIPRIKSVGTTIISAKAPHATYGDDVDVATYTLNVTGPTNVKGEYDKATNTYAFNRVGQALNRNEIPIEGITMSYGHPGSTAVIVKNEKIGPILKVIDANGYSHPNLNNGSANNTIPANDQYGGTYYVFKPSIDGKLTVTGQLSNATIYQYDNGTATMITDGNNGTTMTVSLEKGNTYYLYNGKIDDKNNATPLLHSFSYKPAYSVTLDYDNVIKVDGTPKVDGFAFKNSIKLRPTLKVFDNRSETSTEVNSSLYNVTYSIATPNSGGAPATIDGNGVLTTNKDITGDGNVTVTATITGMDEPLTATFNLMVLSGEWLFGEYTTTYQDKLKTSDYNGGIYSNDPDVWNRTSNDRVRSRDTEKFEYILQGGDNENEPLEIARALQIRYSVRWMRDDGDKGSYLHLFGSYNTKKEHGGILKVPVQKGMIIEIEASSDGEEAEMLINNDGNPLHTKSGVYSAVEDFEGIPTTYFYLSTNFKSYKYVVTSTDKNGFIYIINPSYNLYFYIKSIKLSNDIAFQESTDIYVDGTKDGTANNPILNYEGYTFTYTITKLDGTPIDNNEIKIENTTGLTEYKAGAYGAYTVTATGTCEGLPTVSGSYTLHVIDMKMKNDLEPYTASDDLSWTAEELQSLIEQFSYGDNVLMEAEKQKDLRALTEFSVKSNGEHISKVSMTGEPGNQALSIEGIGNVVIEARLGEVVREITLVVKGVALSDRSPVCSNSDDEITFSINVSENINLSLVDVEEDIAWMVKNVIGDLRDVPLKEGNTDVLSLKYDSDNRTFTLKRSGGGNFAYGGAMPIRIRYKSESMEKELKGIVTIAYSNHSWKFDHNMLLYDHPTYTGIYDFYTDKPRVEIGDKSDIQNRLGVWDTNKSATFDKPEDDNNGNPTGYDEKHTWYFMRKIPLHRETAIVYYYGHSVDGDNAMILPETAGLIINSDKNLKQFAVEMLSTRNKDNIAEANIVKIDTDFDGDLTDEKQTGYDIQNVMLKQGGELVVPHVKPGQWIEMRWYRHTPDRGQLIKMTNLYDVEGKEISDVYKIGNTETGTYMFQVDPTSKENWLDVVFRITDPIYLNIQEIILHEVGWDYESSMKDLQNTDNKLVGYQHIINNGTPITIGLGDHAKQNAPNAPADWQIKVLGNLACKITGDRNIHYSEDDDRYKEEDKNMYYWSERGTAITVTGGWGKVYATLNSYSSDYVYVANRKTWVITFGEAPAQEYPYTWDFTKYFENTKEKIGMGKYDDVFKEDSVYASQNNSYGSHEYRIKLNTWDETGNEEAVVTKGYNTANYGSFFVNGAQLVGYGLRGDTKYKGRLPETAGLGFKLDNLDDEDNVNDGGLSLDMQSSDAKAVEADNNETWRDGCLTITSGGSIIVPKPGEKYDDYYIYVKSDKEPTVDAAEKVTDDVSESDGCELKQYKYHFLANEDVKLKFNDNEAHICAIAVTNKFKTMTALNGTGWATESRDSVIDHTLTRYLTTNPTEAYAIVERYDNPTYSDNKAQTKVALKDRRYVVPANYGLVMKQTENVPELAKDKTTGKATYQVPLFVPAVTTAVDNLDKEEFNLMQPNVKETEITAETETGTSNAMGKDYTRFILASRYMTWKRQDGELTTTEYESGDVAAFYRLHVFDGKDAATLNTLPKNSAYLLLRTDKLNPALWGDASNGSRSYIGIEGVSDMFDEPSLQDAQTGAVGIYNLSGQKLNPDSPLAPGIYIINGKKTIVRGNHD